MILTPTVERNLANIKTSLNTANAVLIQGELGCGKSLCVHHLAELYGAKETMIQVNVDDTFDSKDLLGKYSATDTPGSFEWLPGPLTLAVEKGYWILMEDVDLASFDVFSVILSLLENSTLFISDKNRIIEAHPDFKLIATQQLYVSGDALLSKRSSSVPYAELWSPVIMESIPPSEICTIVEVMYSNVPTSVVENLALLVHPQIGIPLVSLRNLLRWSRRVSRRLPKQNTINSGDSTNKNPNGSNNHNNLNLSANAVPFISSTIREVLLKEAFDCLVAKYAPGAEQNAMLSLVASCCGVPQNIAEPLTLENKPVEHLSADSYSVGRITLPLVSVVSGLSRESRVAFAPTRHAMSLLERLAAALDSNEHVLLTGETGVGKTFIVQYLADQLGQKLIVHNLNQQTDTSDFMGGWKPLDVGVAVQEVYRTFTDLFAESFNAEKNIQFLDSLRRCVSERNWDRTVRQVLKGCSTFKAKNAKVKFDAELSERWSELERQAEEVLDTIEKTKTSFAFFFEEGSLVKAWKEGYWILLDELNLATTEVLERVSSVLGDVDRLFLTDKGDSEPIPRHPNFHVFANMNPPTDVGKKDLPPSLRSRFTECYVSEPFNRNDISIVVKEYIGFLSADAKIDEITTFFLDCVENAKSKLCALDGESKPPSFSLRTLTRALSYVRKATPFYGFTVALFDGLLLGFATPLQRQFHAVVEQLIVKNIFKGKKPRTPVLPTAPQEGNYIAYEHIWIPAGKEEPFCDPAFILTDNVKGHLTNLARAVFANRPVLLEGPTSSGKSSMVKYLAELTGNKFVRINNHDSTEVQEYLGHYVTDELGKLRFVDGILVNAVRHGYWVVLDELNLAPTDVLEALNRLLDDNCELFVPDTQETVKPHPQLRIFATQNPAGIYGGRKMLSRAFRNRFLEITVDEIPTEEISYILQRRYALPESFAEKMVEVMNALQLRRQASQIFAGRHGFITPRDLFRWAERKPATYTELAEHGFLLLGERCRKSTERQIVKDVIETTTKTEINESQLYSPSHWSFVQQYYAKVESGLIDAFKIVWTESMQRLFTVVGICLEHEEPVLLVGETGSSKTTVCQLWAALLGIPLHIINCHQHTEAADFLGSLRPVPPDRRSHALFEWRNGPLVQSMIDGDFFVLDEISLTEDSVLERLNSVLEPSRNITLAEKSSADCIAAHEKFRIMATMNPGGDFGKKELSPALRNRFTEIYVRPTSNHAEVSLILLRRLEPSLASWASKMAAVLCSVADATMQAGVPQHISIRDIIGWVEFMNAAHGKCPEEVAFMQGLDAVILDGVGVGTGQSEGSASVLKQACVMKAKEVTGYDEEPLNRPFWTFFDGMAEPQLPPEMQTRFFFGASATQRNLSKLMRASIVRKAVLLEGSPGVGKTSIVEALGCALSRPVVRINLSEQTDIMDLLGTYLPCPSDDADSKGPQFAWSDGVLLRAVKEGSWVILDELNLASQSVLEGLNALLDHRSTVFIPELNEEYRAHHDFRVFACQNPLMEGGGRKGLPRSFLNRFIRVRVEAFETDDLIRIATAVCPDIEEATLRRMVGFVGTLQHDTMVRRAYGTRGSPWEFNLRDVLRWAKIMQRYNERGNPTYFADLLFLQRMRTDTDKLNCRRTLEEHFESVDLHSACNSDFIVDGDVLYFDNRQLTVRGEAVPMNATATLLLPSQAQLVKSIVMCAEQSQFALLIGPSGAGKSHALRVAANLAGARIVTFSVNASCDTVDLLGGFDQVEGKQGQFEWRDSLVVEAMLQGLWLVLDNVNYCNASVLDRLNPLVEPNGVLSMNEQGLVNNEIRVIRPHPNFRLFATLNPKFGEISRAMRNRAVELYVSLVAIPSVESLVLCGNAARNQNAELLSKLAVFHNDFLKLGFNADPSQATSAQLSDAIAAGAPNVFTLIRASAMLQPEATTAELEQVILHRYINNRSGQWRYKRPELLQLLQTQMQASHPENGDYPRLSDAIVAMNLQSLEPEAPLASILIRNRTFRAGLALMKLSDALLDDGVLDAMRDHLLFYALDQCADSVSLDELAVCRQDFVHTYLPEELSSAASTVLRSQYCAPAMLPDLWCRAIVIVGPYAAALADSRSRGVAFSDSPLVNSAAATVLNVFHAFLDRVSSPEVLQQELRILVPFARHLQNTRDSLNSDNYVSITTLALILLQATEKLPPASAREMVDALLQLFDAVKHYLDLPFPLIGGKSLLHHCVPRPHITTAEERDTFRQWQLTARQQEDMEAREHVSKQLLRPLWQSAAFRAEFELVQRLLRMGLESPTASDVAKLKQQVAAFISNFTTKLPLFSTLEMTLWKGVLALPVEDFEQNLGQFIPLITTRFIARYGLPSVRYLFPGAWMVSATRCLQYAGQTSVVAVGDPHNDHSLSLTGLASFLSTCAVSGRAPFAAWEDNGRRELRRLLINCFPDLAARIPAAAANLEIPSGSLLEVARDSLRSESLSPAVEEQKPLITKILALLSDDNSDLLPIVSLIWALKCRLLLPQSPIDPMYQLERKMDIASEQLALLRRLESAFTCAEKLTMRTRTPQMELLMKLRESEMVQHSEASVEFVERPDRSGLRYATLIRRLYQTCSSLLSDDRLDGIVARSGVKEEGEKDTREAQRVAMRNSRETWSELLSQEVVEMLDHFGGYEDVTVNFAEAALLASLAARASCYASSSTSSKRTLFNLTETTELLQFPNHLVGALPLPPSGSTLLQHRLSYLDAMLTMVCGAVPQGVERDFVDLIFQSFRALFKNVEDLEEHERRQEEMSVRYKEKALVIEGDDEKMLRRLKDMFPSYEQEFIDAGDADGSDEADRDDDDQQRKQEGRAAKHTRIMFRERDGIFIRRLVKTHRVFYQRLISSQMSTPVDVNALLDSFRARFDVLSSELGRYDVDCVARDVGEPGEQLLLNGFASRAAFLRRDLKGGQGTLEERNAAGFNIFADSDPSELSRFSKPLAGLLSALSKLAAIYPDTVSLQRCLRIGRKVASLPVLTTPLMKTMAGCEILLRECYEWERNASHEVSIMPHMTELSAFVLRWRRLELHCWSHVFRAKYEEFELNASFQWFNFYDLVHEDPAATKEEDETEVEWLERRCRTASQLFSGFMWGACYGDFSHRLGLVRAFGFELIAYAGYYSPLANVALHIADFFAQFEPFLLEQRKRTIQPIEEDIEDFTRIMRWEDANYYAVRATAEKSHLKMARVLGSLEVALRTPILQVISAEEERCEEDAAMGFILPSEVFSDKKATKGKKDTKGGKEESGGKSVKGGKRQRRGQRRDVLGGSAKDTTVENAFGEWSCEAVSAAHEFLDSSATEIIHRVQALQAPKTTNQMKIRALKSFFDVMTDAGVPHVHVDQISQWEIHFASTEALLGCRTVHDDQQDVVALLDTAAGEHYRFVRWLQRMRDAERNPSQDLSGAQVKRGTGFAESLFAHAVTAADLVCALFQLRRELSVLRLYVGACATATQGDAAEDEGVADISLLDACVRVSSSAQALVGSLNWMLQERVVQTAESSDRALLEELSREATGLWHLCEQYEPLRRTGGSIPPVVGKQYLAALRRLYGVCGRLQCSKERSIASAAAVHEQRVGEVLTTHDKALRAAQRGMKRPRVEDVEKDSAMAASWTQQLQELLGSVDEALADNAIVSSPTLPAEADATLPVYEQYVQKLCSLKSMILELTRTAQSLQEMPEDRTMPTVLRNEVLGQISFTTGAVSSVQRAMITTLAAHSKMGVVVARLFTVLMKKGFCKTEDDDDNDGEGDGEGDGEQKDGTGMDDGQGEKDVTDQIENEDQLMNMKDKEEQEDQDEKQKENEGDDGEDNAADVETDFQGQKEKREESEEDDGGEDGEESDKDVGSVDGDEAQERKKTKKDEGDDNDMNEDDGGAADDVPKDEFGDEQPMDEETGGFDNKEDEIRDAEEKSDGKAEHELVGNEEGIEDDGADSDDDGQSVERSADDDDDANEDEEKDVEDDAQSADPDQEQVEKDDGSEDRAEDDKSTDQDRSTEGEREIEGDEAEERSASDVDDASDGPDENIFEGGQQDDQSGQEATERREKKDEQNQTTQQDAAGNEEEQAGEEQKQDDAGRSWKRQQEENQNAQRRDNTERNRARHNPYRAVKEAVQRHQRQVQQLNLNEHVEVKDDPADTKERAAEDKPNPPADEDKVEQFDFDENGEQEGMAATEEAPQKPTEAEDEVTPSASDEGSEDEEDFEESAQAPQDARRKREQQADELNDVTESGKDSKKQKRKSKASVNVTAREENPDSDDREDDEGLEQADDAEGLDEKLERGRKLWQEQETAVQGLSQQLCEQLRLILAPTLADKLQGDYKTGKRLNMKRIIPYIASQFKKDRIWLRRTKPNKRTYQIMVALDDSLSMQSNNAGVLSCRAVALIAKALQQLEVGEVGITSFGKETKFVHALEEPFVADSGAKAFGEITFQQTSTNLKLFLESTLDYLDASRDRMQSQSRSTTQQLQQIMFVISDGQITEDRAELRKLLVRAEENHQMVVFVLLDIKASSDDTPADASPDSTTSSAPAPPSLNPKDLRGLSTAERMRRLKADRNSRLKRVQSSSILDMQLVEFKNGKVVRRSYMEDFPFPYYLVVRELQNLPEIIADAMRQWFELLNAGQ